MMVPNWPVADLQEGEDMLIPYLTDDQGVRRPSQKVLHVAIYRYARKAGFKVQIVPEAWGLRVRRTPEAELRAL